MGLGDHSGAGLDHLAHEKLVSRFVGSHFVLSPRQMAMIEQNQVEALGLPAGSISLLYREIAAGRPGLFTDIGLDTFVDPRKNGWKAQRNHTERDGIDCVHLGEEMDSLPDIPHTCCTTARFSRRFRGQYNND